METPLEITGGEVKSKALVTEEAIISTQMKSLPSAAGMTDMIKLVVASAARDIITGVLPFRSAGEASKVARDFVAIAKDLQWDTEAEALKKAETAEDRLDVFEQLRQKAQENLK